jgi:hydroxymethylglutaryl-CoA synthase
MQTGIVSYGAYVPRYRITPAEIGRVWGTDGESMSKGLLIRSKSVPGPDEDVITMSVEAARAMMRRVPVDPQEIGALYVGSESHPYAVKPTGAIVAEAIGASPNLTVADYEFACKAGTAAIQTCMGLVGAGMVRYGVAIGADTSQGAPGDPLEYSASAGAAAFLIGSEDPIAIINKTVSYTTDTPDFWRREGQQYPSHGGRFTGEPAYFKHVQMGGKNLLEAVGSKPSDYTHAIFHQPNGKFPQRVAKMLGFTDKQIEVGMLSPEIGNTYSGAIPLGLAAVLDVAKPGDRIFAVAYGSGAGSDAFDITVTDGIDSYAREKAATVRQLVERKVMVDYATYAKFRRKIRMKGVCE